jgi:hypothetical protein
VLPFSKRPPPPEEFFLRSGDFEAVQQNPTIPPPPRAPIFHRSAAPPSYGFGYGQTGSPYQDGYSMSGAAAPSSLAPVAMQQYANNTGSQRIQAQMPTVVIRGKQTVKWGVMIVLAGAFIGGTLGVTLRNERVRAAAEHAAANELLPPPAPVPMPTQQNIQSSLAGPTVIPQQPPAPPPQAFAHATVVPPQAPVVIPPPPKTTKKSAPVFHAAPVAPAQPPRGMVATKVNPPPAPPPAVKEPAKPLPPKSKENADAIDLLKRAQAESGSSL